MFAILTSAFQVADLIIATEAVLGGGAAVIVAFIGARFLIRTFNGSN